MVVAHRKPGKFLSTALVICDAIEHRLLRSARVSITELSICILSQQYGRLFDPSARVC